MHLCFVTDTWPPEINGVAQTVRSFAEGMRGLGHEVSLVRPCQGGESPRVEPEQLLTRGAGLPRYQALRFGFPCRARLRAHWQARRPDALYIATEGLLGWSAQRSARDLGIPLATGFHTRFDQYAAAYGLGLAEPFVAGWLRRFHARARATLVPTEELADRLRSQGYRALQVVGRGVDTAQFAPSRRDPALRHQFGANDATLVLLHVGRVAAEKNLALAIRAWEALAQTRADLRFVVVGDGPELPRLKARHPGILFTGALPRDTLARCYASADLFLFPSLSETFGNVTLEALASGLPLVAFNYAAARQYVSHQVSGLLVRYADEDAFIGAALRLAGDAGLRARIRVEARAAVLHASVDAVVGRFASVLEQVAARETGP